MKKLIWSTFALSLIILTPKTHSQEEFLDDFLNVETEVVPEKLETENFITPTLDEEKTLKINPKKVEIDAEPNKGQGYSIIPWSTQDPEDWLSIKTWIIEREMKDKSADWNLRLRASEYQELVGKVLQCRGECEIFRGTKSIQGQHLSRVHEGDELRTGKNSYAWIFMMDGSLMRISPESSVSVNEFNIGKKDFFFLVRLNHGHLYWGPRTKKDHALEYGPETDSGSLPLMVREANQQYYERAVFKSQRDKAHLNEVMTLDDGAINLQIHALNELRKENSSAITLGTRVMVVTPNSSIVSRDASFDFVYLPGGKSYFKKRTSEEGEEFSLHLRGYLETGVTTITSTNWNEVDVTGRNHQSLEEAPGILQVLELLTKRIKSIELAREIWTENFVQPMMKVKDNPKLLARDFGYTLWGDEIDQRFNFLVEYTRRIETTNLMSVENLLAKLQAKGESFSRELSESQYQASLNHYLLGLKTRYDKRKMRVREMNDLQYYVWILKNGKL
jgi:hypothetical protein